MKELIADFFGIEDELALFDVGVTGDAGKEVVLEGVVNDVLSVELELVVVVSLQSLL